MPRSRRGGKRAGKPGTAYGNRTDLNGTKALPMQAASGQAYGERKAQMDAQRAIPLTPPSRPQPGGGQPSMASVPVTPGALDFTRPTERPQEPVTAGLAVGAGPGPEVLGGQGPDPDLMQLARYLPTLEFMASQPDASATTRNLVRRMRGMMPVEGF